MCKLVLITDLTVKQNIEKKPARCDVVNPQFGQLYRLWDVYLLNYTIKFYISESFVVKTVFAHHTRDSKANFETPSGSK